MSAAPPPPPEAARPFIAFPAYLRAHGFAAAPDQTVAFLQSIELLGPRGVEDIRRAATAILAPPIERRDEFDALFNAFFLGRPVAAPILETEAGEEDLQIHEPRGVGLEIPEGDPTDTGGAEATGAEALSVRRFDALDEAEALRRFAREAPRRLPERRARRRSPHRRGATPDLRRALRQAVRRDGEALELPRLKRRRTPRPILLMIDISGSMSAATDGALRLAHALKQASPRAEIFTFGTRLTRLTRPLSLRRREQALAAAGAAAPDWDGGTRIGEALAAFLATPRLASLARGALTIVLSDGLERGDPTGMIRAVETLSRLSWRLHWLTPLAADPDFAPRTAALVGALPHLDHLGEGGDVRRIAAHLLSIVRTA